MFKENVKEKMKVIIQSMLSFFYKEVFHGFHLVKGNGSFIIIENNILLN